MISLRKLRKTAKSFKEKLALKHDETNVDQILLLDEKTRELKTKSNDLRAERNSASEAIGEAKKAGHDASDAIKKTRELGDHLKELEQTLKEVEYQLNSLLFQIPNLPHESVPKGSDELDNIEIRSWGKKPVFSFHPKNHLDLGDALELFDFQRGAKISGSGFPLYTGQGAKLERALINGMIHHHDFEFGFKEFFR